MSTAPLTEARDRLSEIVDEVSTRGTEWIITRHGRPTAVIVSFADYEALIETLNILSDEDTMEALDEAAEDLAEGRIGDAASTE